jgi:hypothetical protein
MGDVKIFEHVNKFAVKQFTHEEIRALDTWQELIPSPGPNRFIQILSVTTISKQGSDNYGAHPLTLKYGDGSGAEAMQNSLHWGVLNCSHDKITHQFGNESGSGIELDGGFDDVKDKAVGIIAGSQPEQDGTGEITIKISYIEHEI